VSALSFGVGWPDTRGRRRTLLWIGDVGWLLLDDGYDVAVIRRGCYDEIDVRACLLGWQDHVDDPRGTDWLTERVCTWAPGAYDPDDVPF